jgi:tRNA threonylcarbamoyl adenosine modification protein (Sua5/YciO/YrdC/YwlC family)
VVARLDRHQVRAQVDAPGLARIICALEAGAVVALPTDTVYGLAVLPGAAAGVDRLFEMKGRPDSIAVALLVADVAQAERLMIMNDTALRLAATFWPGALTIVAERALGLGLELGGDESTIGVRCPNAAYVQQICQRLGPIAVTSANRHGEQPAESVAMLRHAFGSQLLIADGGQCCGEPSTVVDVRGDSVLLLRAGAIGYDEVCAALAPAISS